MTRTKMSLLPSNANYVLLLYEIVVAVNLLIYSAVCDINDVIVDSGEEPNFCDDNYVDSAYYNGYDIIITRGDWLWYYYKDNHNISVPFSQEAFTQGDHIQGAFNISRIPKCDIDEVIDCREILKMKNIAVYFLHNKPRSRGYYNLDIRNRNGSQRRAKPKQLPWGMKQVGLLGGNMWPNGWEAYQEHRPVAFLPSRYELIFIMNGKNGTVSKLAWNSLDTVNWNDSWNYKNIGSDIMFTGMFEMNGIVYAIGEERRNQVKRVGKIYRYHISGGNDRKLTPTNQYVSDFFGCPQSLRQQIPPQTPPQSTTTTLAPTIRTNREIKTGNIINRNSNGNSSASGKDEDPILVSIFIGIVIAACLTTIILSFITISSRRNKKVVESREETVPKSTVVGLDYNKRTSSHISNGMNGGMNGMNGMSLNKYTDDNMSSITAIYSQISRPKNHSQHNHNTVQNHNHHNQNHAQNHNHHNSHHQQQHSRPNSLTNGIALNGHNGHNTHSHSHTNTAKSNGNIANGKASSLCLSNHCITNTNGTNRKLSRELSSSSIKSLSKSLKNGTVNGVIRHQFEDNFTDKY